VGIWAAPYLSSEISFSNINHSAISAVYIITGTLLNITQVLGLKPYEEHSTKTTKALAASILRATKAPINARLEKLYMENLAVLVR